MVDLIIVNIASEGLKRKGGYLAASYGSTAVHNLINFPTEDAMRYQRLLDIAAATIR